MIQATTLPEWTSKLQPENFPLAVHGSVKKITPLVKIILSNRLTDQEKQTTCTWLLLTTPELFLSQLTKELVKRDLPFLRKLIHVLSEQNLPHLLAFDNFFLLERLLLAKKIEMLELIPISILLDSFKKLFNKDSETFLTYLKADRILQLNALFQPETATQTLYFFCLIIQKCSLHEKDRQLEGMIRAITARLELFDQACWELLNSDNSEKKKKCIREGYLNDTIGGSEEDLLFTKQPIVRSETSHQKIPFTPDGLRDYYGKNSLAKTLELIPKLNEGLLPLFIEFSTQYIDVLRKKAGSFPQERLLKEIELLETVKQHVYSSLVVEWIQRMRGTIEHPQDYIIDRRKPNEEQIALFIPQAFWFLGKVTMELLSTAWKIFVLLMQKMGTLFSFCYASIRTSTLARTFFSPWAHPTK